MLSVTHPQTPVRGLRFKHPQCSYPYPPVSARIHPISAAVVQAIGVLEASPLPPSRAQITGSWDLVFSSASKIKAFQYIPIDEKLVQSLEGGARDIALRGSIPLLLLNTITGEADYKEGGIVAFQWKQARDEKLELLCWCASHLFSPSLNPDDQSLRPFDPSSQIELKFLGGLFGFTRPLTSAPKTYRRGTNSKWEEPTVEFVEMSSCKCLLQVEK